MKYKIQKVLWRLWISVSCAVAYKFCKTKRSFWRKQ